MSRINIDLGKTLPGDILITRWNDEDRNTTPGDWNHSAICVGNNTIIEAVDKKGVISLLYPEFLAISDQIKIVRLSIGKEKRQLMADEATRYLGTPYRKLASLFFRLFRRSVNCTSLMRRCYMKATGIDPRWRIPDDILREKNYSYWRVR